MQNAQLYLQNLWKIRVIFQVFFILWFWLSCRLLQGYEHSVDESLSGEDLLCLYTLNSNSEIFIMCMVNPYNFYCTDIFSLTLLLNDGVHINTTTVQNNIDSKLDLFFRKSGSCWMLNLIHRIFGRVDSFFKLSSYFDFHFLADCCKESNTAWMNLFQFNKDLEYLGDSLCTKSAKSSFFLLDPYDV